MKILFEEYGRMTLSIICAMITIVFLAIFMTALGEVNNNHLDNAIGAETTIINRETAIEEATTQSNETSTDGETQTNPTEETPSGTGIMSQPE